MSRVDRVSEVAEQLERSILSGELAPGDQLPSEREISAQLGVSRSVVREALGRLTSLGMVRSVHGSGTRVQVPSGRPIAVGFQRLIRAAEPRLEHLSEVRLPLETAIAATAAVTRTDEDLERMEKCQRVLGDSSLPLEEHAKADCDFHAALAEATGNPVFQIILAPITELLIESRRRTLGRYGSPLAHEHHAQILEAVRARDADRAERTMRMHIEANFQHLREQAEEAVLSAADPSDD